MNNLAVAVLAAGLMRNYLWNLFPIEMMGAVSKALGAAAILFLLTALYVKAKPNWPLAIVCVLWAFEELQTLICSVSYAIEPWAVQPGQSICSARLDFDLGAIGILLAAGVLYVITKGRTP